MVINFWTRSATIRKRTEILNQLDAIYEVLCDKNIELDDLLLRQEDLEKELAKVTDQAIAVEEEMRKLKETEFALKRDLGRLKSYPPAFRRTVDVMETL